MGTPGLPTTPICSGDQMRLDVGEFCKLRRILQMTSGYLTSISEWGLGVLGTKAGKVWGLWGHSWRCRSWNSTQRSPAPNPGRGRGAALPHSYLVDVGETELAWEKGMRTKQKLYIPKKLKRKRGHI